MVESVKAASDIYAPIDGNVIAVNEALEEQPELVNTDPFGEGWFFKLRPLDLPQLDELLSASDYVEQCEAQDH